ncbi:Transposable element tcb1 transposase [Caligus rogercresseyi]|uniref:Transposable element tcb1 transposase n=1 Tax=Caligus rogercresseyi TaxID=217165 RepID=A0A7T8HLG2_CALRO|nr:Transposable element tcb1 transposase [Caligus rogercresseyi]
MELPPTHQSWPRTSAQGIFPVSGQQTTGRPQAQISTPGVCCVGFFLERETKSTPHPNVDSLKASITAA